MTDNSRDDRRRNFNGRINTLGTGSNGVGRRDAGNVGSREGEREEEEAAADAPLADEEAPEREESGDEADAEDSEDEESARADGVTPEADVPESDDDEERANGVSPEADVSTSDDEDEEEAATVPNEVRTEDVDDRATLEIELDAFVRAYAARRADETDESLDEYVVGSVKGYLAGLLGGDVSSPGTLKREVDVEADPIFGGLLEVIGGEEKEPEEVVIDAVAEAYDVPVDEDTLVVAGLRDHEALLNGVVANGSNDLNDISEVVQAAVETRLIEEPA